MSDEKTRPKRAPSPRPTNPTPTQTAQPAAQPQPAQSAEPVQLTHSIQQVPPIESASSAPRFLSGIPNWLAFWLPIFTSILSLVVAVAGFIAATQDPDVNMILPRLVRMVQSDQAAVLYVQPKFISTGRNDRLDVITDISLRVEPIGGGPGADFTWEEQGVWNYDPSARELTYIYIADAGPLMVSPSNPQLPVGLFVGPPNWTFIPGDYQITITATRAVGSTPLQGTIVVPFPEDLIASINSSQGTRFAEFPVKP